MIFSFPFRLYKFLPGNLRVYIVLTFLLAGFSGFIEASLAFSVYPLIDSQTQKLDTLAYYVITYFPFVALAYVVSKFSATLLLSRLGYISGAFLSSLAVISSSSRRYISTPSSEIVATLTTFSNAIVSSIILPSTRILCSLLVIFSFFILSLSDLLAFFIKSPFLLILISGCCLCLFFVFVKILSRLTINNSRIIVDSYKRIACIAESVSRSSLEYIFTGVPMLILADFFRSSLQLRLAQFRNELFSLVPRLVLESFAFIGVLIPLIYGDAQQRALSVTFSIAFIRLLPLLQQIYASYTTMAGTSEESRSIINALELVSTSSKETFSSLAQSKFRQRSLSHITSSANQIHEYRRLNDNVISVFISKSAIPYLTFKYDFTISLALGFTFIVGPSGSGKSSLIKYFLRSATTPESPLFYLRNQIDYMIQFPYLPPLPVIDFIKQHTLDSKSSFDRALEIYSRLNLPRTLLAEDCQRLSGGQVKRLSILRMILSMRKILIFDEPFSGLPNQESQNTLAVMREYADNRRMIVISHYLDGIIDSDSVIHLSDLR